MQLARGGGGDAGEQRSPGNIYFDEIRAVIGSDATDSAAQMIAHGHAAQFLQREDGSWLIDGHLPIHEAERALGRKDLARGDNYNTMAGFVLWHLGRMPVPGEKLAWRDLSIEVIDMDGLVIDKLLVQPRSAQGLRAGQV